MCRQRRGLQRGGRPLPWGPTYSRGCSSQDAEQTEGLGEDQGAPTTVAAPWVTDVMPKCSVMGTWPREW